MDRIPAKLEHAFIQDMKAAGIEQCRFQDWLKWLRFYLDFCKKYEHLPREEGSLAPFIAKLASKRQSVPRQNDARECLGVFYETVSRFPRSGEAGSSVEEPKVESESWAAVNQDLEGAFALRQLARATCKTYGGWIRKFQQHVAGKPPEQVAAEDAAAFLTALAEERKLGASAQNQAFNALLFLFCHVLQKDFELGDTVTRAKRRKHVPQILSQAEIAAIVEDMRHPYTLVTQLLYGCGLRLSEGVGLRVQNFDFDQMVLTIGRGKGGKDRTVPIPESLRVALQAHLVEVKNLYDSDLAHPDFLGAFMPEGSPQKWLPRSKDWPWQFFFPARTLTLVPDENGYRRYHLHDTHYGKKLRKTVRRLKLTKRVTAHTFRHSFASHLLLANYDIRTVQVMLGHSHVKTTMIYTQTVPSRTIKEQKSPLDLEIETDDG